MAGSIADPRIGVGSALRRAREVRRLSLDDAARDTRLRVEQLDALEREEFDVLPGEVYVRASLRTYASYLGLDADELTGAYTRVAEPPEPLPPPRRIGGIERMIAASRIRDNQRFLLISAVSILVILIGFGLLSRDAAVPSPATLPTGTISPIPSDPAIHAVLVARGEVDVRSVLDGREVTYHLRPGETIAIEAFERMRLTVSDSGLVRVSLAGQDVTLSDAGSPHTYTFSLGDAGGGPSSAA